MRTGLQGSRFPRLQGILVAVLRGPSSTAATSAKGGYLCCGVGWMQVASRYWLAGRIGRCRYCGENRKLIKHQNICYVCDRKRRYERDPSARDQWNLRVREYVRTRKIKDPAWAERLRECARNNSRRWLEAHRDQARAGGLPILGGRRGNLGPAGRIHLQILNCYGSSRRAVVGGAGRNFARGKIISTTGFRSVEEGRTGPRTWFWPAGTVTTESMTRCQRNSREGCYDGMGRVIRFPPQPGELPWRLPAKGA